jgi:hypothetical protein
VDLPSRKAHSDHPESEGDLPGVIGNTIEDMVCLAKDGCSE